MARLYPAYTRDVLSFLNFAQLQECRQVSHSINSTIVNYPVAIPARRRLNGLTLSVGSAAHFFWSRIGDDGYADNPMWKNNSWKVVQADWNCCREEFEDLADSLAGERILPSYHADCLVQFMIEVDSWHETLLCVRNEMSAETAFGVLHLLDHLHSSTISFSTHQSHIYNSTGVGGDMALNPSIIRVLSRANGRTFKLHARVHALAVEHSADRLIAEVSYLKIEEMRWTRGQNLAVLFDFALRGKPRCKRIKLETVQTEDTFNAVLQHFLVSIPRIGRNVVSELVVHGYTNNLDFWPTGLPARKDMELVHGVGFGEEMGGQLYRLPEGGLTNANSGERFDVEMVYKRVEWRDEVEARFEMRLRFS